MKNKITNPFVTGGYLEPEYFCDRKNETEILLKAVSSKRNLTLISLRRMGKTGLLKHVKYLLGQGQKGSGKKQKPVAIIYVDLMPTMNGNDMMNTLCSALVRLKQDEKSFPAKVLAGLARLRPRISFDSLTGQPSVELKVESSSDIQFGFDHLLHFISEIKHEMVFMFDEFQQILEYGNDHVERKLRSVIQHHRQVGYLFLGSRKHLIQKMVLDRNRPLYRAGGHYPLGPIAEKHWQPFIRQRFADAEKGIGQEHIHEVCELTQGHPFYTQHLCHVLWELCEPKAEVNGEMLRAAVKVLLARESYAYTTLWESLTLSQKRFLTGLAAEPAGVKVFAGDFVSRHGLGSASNAQRAVQALLSKDVIDRDNGSFLITDRFFRLWIQSVQSA